MTQAESTPLEQALVRLFPSRWLWARARAIGVVRRRRKVDPVAFVWTLVLGFGTGKHRTLAGLRRLFVAVTGRRVSPSTFYDRFTPELVRYLRELIDHGMQATEPIGDALRGRLAAFKDLLVTDSTVIRLADLLQKSFPACRTNHTLAAAKLHVVMSVAGAGLRSIRVTSERTSDGATLRVGKWVKDRLLLFDLGFYRYQLFSCITRQGGHFISRLKENGNPMIMAQHGVDQTLVGRRLQDVLRGLRRPSLDVEVELDFKRRIYAGRRNSAKERFRLVGIRNAEERRYHLYLTRIPKETLSAEDVGRVYALRWEIELLFKEMKSGYRLEDMPSASRHITEALLYASVLSLIASRVLLRALRRRLRLEHRGRLRHLRWAYVLRAHAPLLLEHVLRAAGTRVAPPGSLLRAILSEAVDPNASRGDLVSRTQLLLGAERQYVTK